MRRSVGFRFLALALGVALGAVIATAVIATYSTSEQLQGQIDTNISQLQVDGDIYYQLRDYAAGHDSWAGVGKLVQELADRTGRRVALTGPDGKVIADSAKLPGTGPDLPSTPAATIDARRELPGLLATARAVPAGTAVAGLAAAPAAAVPVMSSLSWGLTDDELRQRRGLAEQAVACYRRQGKTATVVGEGRQAPDVVLRSERTVEGVAVTEMVSQTGSTDPCQPAGLTAPSAKSRLVNDDEVRRATDCLRAAGEAYSLSQANGLTTVVPANQDPARTTGRTTGRDPGQDPARALGANPGSERFRQCTSQARVDALAPYVAPEARLFLGSRSTFNVFSSEGLVRTAATALGVLLVAGLVMVVAGRRLTRPIVALTGAARRMTTGDHAARVPVTGRDEVARLGHAFNAMADSIERHDHQRKALVSDVAHELRTPLATIKGYLVASEDGVVPLDRELVTSLLEEADLLERLVTDLQDLALADAGMLRLHPGPRDLSELAQQVVAAHRPAADTAGIDLTLTTDGPAPAVVDGARIRQALGNLVSNAIRYTPDGGRVEVGVHRSGNDHMLTVTDNGRGIAADHLPYLFDRFYRVEHSRSRTTGGSGLGLAITKHLADGHGGSIAVRSTPGEGSTFTLRLPAGDPEAPSG